MSRYDLNRRELVRLAKLAANLQSKHADPEARETVRVAQITLKWAMGLDGSGDFKRTIGRIERQLAKQAREGEGATP